MFECLPILLLNCSEMAFCLNCRLEKEQWWAVRSLCSMLPCSLWSKHKYGSFSFFFGFGNGHRVPLFESLWCDNCANLLAVSTNWSGSISAARRDGVQRTGLQQLNTDTHRPGEALCIHLVNWSWEDNLWIDAKIGKSVAQLQCWGKTVSRILFIYFQPIAAPFPTVSQSSIESGSRCRHSYPHTSVLWISWPTSICLHQSYQLTQGLDSSMLATPVLHTKHPFYIVSVYPFMLSLSNGNCAGPLEKM